MKKNIMSIWISTILLILTLTASSVFAVAPPPGPGGTPDYFGIANWAFSPPLEKFIDSLAPLGCTTKNTLNQCIPVAVPDTITYPGSDYYEISLVEFTQKMHFNLPATTLRGYVQTNNGTDPTGLNTLIPEPVRYLGPIISAQKDRPVRIKFTNNLASGGMGNLFLPVDTTVMGAGLGPLGPAGGKYTQNRGSLHLHGGHTPWISDGTPHQWIAPAGESVNTTYLRGASVFDVPDMPNPGPGAQTYYYTNQQSSRLMFYHDHAYGITRLNVYAGEAAGYLVTDDAEKYLINAGIIPADQIPLIIQDKSFVDATLVPHPTTGVPTPKILTTDPTWNSGTTAPVPNQGDLWYPHVYVPAQNPFDVSGINPFGRWPYGPWFWPPTTGITFGPVANPYYDPACVPSPTIYCQPPENPGVPDLSMPAESYFDTAVVNGTVFPYLVVDAKSYRFRILNASNDRFWNLQLYKADPSVITSDFRTKTEVKMVPAVSTAGFPPRWPIDGREGGVPDPTMMGPDFIQIGNESGFLPKPVVISSQPIVWNADPTTFNFGNVSDHGLLIAAAERADVIIDFSQYAGQTLILYNDAPAAFPALDARYDYYTGAPDLTATGGHSGPQAGFGPNIRTVMQIRVNPAPVPPNPQFNLATLNASFASTPTSQGIFETSQHPILVGQTAYNTAYNKIFPVTWPNWGVARIQDNQLSFNTVPGGNLTIQLNHKGIHDEMGSAFDPEYGRLSSRMGIEFPVTVNQRQNFVLYGFIDPTTEILVDSITPGVPVAGDGTQIWKITHNGVDTHPIHFHLFDVQLINRVGWDGAIRLPDENELGWKETVRISPLEDTIVALRPTAPKVPFVVPNSMRLMDTTKLAGSTMGFTNMDPVTGQAIVPPITNDLADFGWEYVWHCHILSHEEMDMMRPMKFVVASPNTYVIPEAPTIVSATAGNAIATISFSPPVNNGTPITSYIVTSNPGNLTATRATSPISITGLLNGATYNFTVAAVNSAGVGLSSNPTNNVMPVGPSTYSITTSFGPGGTISPIGIVSVNQGTSQTFTITPSLGYSVLDVKVDNVSVGAVTSYTFNNVLANHTISATFTINTFTITTTAGTGGTISPAPSATVNYGANQTFAITPAVGNHITDVLIDGISVGVMSSYTFPTVIANHTIAATFAVNTYTLASSTGAGGTISPLGATIVNYGAMNQTYNIVPSVGYHIADVLVDGASVGAVPSYTFNNVTADHTISATFATNTFTITTTTGTGGTISPSPSATVNYGGSQTFTITPAAGYAIATLTVDGVAIPNPTSPYTLTNVTANKTISVTFAQFKYLLWRDATGQACIWKIDPTGAHTILHLFPAIVGWTPLNYSRDAAGNGYLLWKDTTGKACIWKIDPTGGHTILHLFPAISGWTPISYSMGADGNGYLFWRDATGKVCIWKIDPTGAHTILHLFPAIVGWTPLFY